MNSAIKAFPMIAAICLVFGSGCATSAMKGTPFYTGEYSKRVGVPEDRVNMWPLVYYRNPALSVLWPLMELSDEHFALRPLMSVQGLGSEKKVYNVLWPLGQVDQQSRTGRLFPVFWGEGRFNVFPLYWHERNSGGLLDSLFPAWVVMKRGDDFSYHLLWPVLNWKKWDDECGWRVWPLSGHYRNGGSSYGFAGWPLGHFWKNSERNGGSCLFPLYYYQKDEAEKTFMSLPYSFSRGGPGEWDCAVPFFLSRRDAEGSLFASPVYCASRKKEGDGRRWSVPLLLTWGESHEQSGSVFVGAVLGHKKWDERGVSSHVMPVYYKSSSGAGRRFISLPYSYSRTGSGGWDLVPPLYFGSRDESRSCFVTPLYARGKTFTDDAYWSALMPFYYRDGDADSRRIITLAGGWSESGDARSWFLLPLLSGGSASEDSGSLWLGGGLFHRSRDSEGSYHHLLPFYCASSKNEAFMSLPYCKWKSQSGKTTRIYPPLLSSFNSDAERRKLLLLAGLSVHEWGGGVKSGYTVPLYKYGKDHLYTPVVGWKKEGRKGFVYPLTPLAGFRTGAEKGGWLFPLFNFRKAEEGSISGSYLWGRFWANGDAGGSSLFPLYSYVNHGSGEVGEGMAASGSGSVRQNLESGREFWCLPVCWYSNLIRNRPVYEDGRYKGEYARFAEKKHGVFPVWSYSSRNNMKNGKSSSDMTLLLRLYDSRYESEPDQSHEYIRRRVLWRLYHYEKLKGDVSVDIFPFITYDSKAEGDRSFSFMWRLFSYRKTDKGRKVHILFVPFGKGK